MVNDKWLVSWHSTLLYLVDQCITVISELLAIKLMRTLGPIMTKPSKIVLWLFRIDFRAVNEDSEYVRSLDVKKTVL